MVSQATLEAFEKSDPLVRYIVGVREERRKDAHDREAIVAHLQEQLRSGDKSLVGNKGYRRYLKLEGSGHWRV